MKDMVEVIRCKDCKWWNAKTHECSSPEWFITTDIRMRTRADMYCFLGEENVGESYEVKDGVRIKI